MPSFASLIGAGQASIDGFVVDVPDTWHQGRTAYGGFSSALCLHVAQKLGGADLPPLRSAQLAMSAPVVGRVTVTAKIERQGRNATWISAHVTGENGPAFSANFVFMGGMTSQLMLHDYHAPAGLIPVSEAQDMAFTPHTPAFLKHNFEARYALPPVDGKQPNVCRWVRSKDRTAIDPMVELLLIGDALPPGVMPLLSVPVPVSTMHWQVGLLTSQPATHDGWWLLRSTADYAENGCSNQRMGIWNSDCTPVVEGMQSIAIFG